MTWYPFYVHFFIACPRGNERKLQRITELLYCAFCVYGANITDEFEDVVMDEIIQTEMPEAIYFVARPWGDDEFSPIPEEYDFAMKDPELSWVYMVTFSQTEGYEEQTLYTNFELSETAHATQEDFDMFLERNTGKIGHHYVGGGTDERVYAYLDSISGDNGRSDDFNYDLLLPGAPFIEIPNVKVCEIEPEKESEPMDE